MGKETPEAEEARKEQERLDAEDMGNKGKAKDGEPVDIEKRRKGRSAGAQLDTAGNEAATTGEESDGQTVWEVDPTGKKMSLGTLLPRNVPVEFKVQVQGKSINMKDGINDPQQEQVAVSSLSVEGFNIRYTRDGVGNITKVIVTEIKVAKSVNPARSEAGQQMLGLAHPEREAS